jgi:hypothetical protein
MRDELLNETLFFDLDDARTKIANSTGRPSASKKRFKQYPIGSFHIDSAEIRTEEGKLYLFVAIDRTSKIALPACLKGPMQTFRLATNPQIRWRSRVKALFWKTILFQWRQGNTLINLAVAAMAGTEMRQLSQAMQPAPLSSD